ncbi:hypothetical protein HDU98_007406 [Podochytrium sp. JEL0797]|nr:hypothetical protein HDU98_007406 [Podochytrium sp. JEL0797]
MTSTTTTVTTNVPGIAIGIIVLYACSKYTIPSHEVPFFTYVFDPCPHQVALAICALHIAVCCCCIKYMRQRNQGLVDAEIPQGPRVYAIPPGQVNVQYTVPVGHVPQQQGVYQQYAAPQQGGVQQQQQQMLPVYQPAYPPPAGPPPSG